MPVHLGRRAERTGPARSARRHRMLWVVAVAAALVGVALETGLVGVATVRSPSMAPTYAEGGHLVTTRIGAGDPQPGDVVVFETPDAWAVAAEERGTPLDEELTVKRVVAVGGQRVVCCAPGGLLVVDGEVLDEPYLAAPPDTMSNPTYDVTVPEGHLWLLGDNRRRSFDSRAMDVRERGAGFVPVSAVRARVLLAY